MNLIERELVSNSMQSMEIDLDEKCFGVLISHYVSRPIYDYIHYK